MSTPPDGAPTEEPEITPEYLLELWNIPEACRSCARVLVAARFASDYIKDADRESGLADAQHDARNFDAANESRKASNNALDSAAEHKDRLEMWCGMCAGHGMVPVDGEGAEDGMECKVIAPYDDYTRAGLTLWLNYGRPLSARNEDIDL